MNEKQRKLFVKLLLGAVVLGVGGYVVHRVYKGTQEPKETATPPAAGEGSAEPAQATTAPLAPVAEALAPVVDIAKAAASKVAAAADAVGAAGATIGAPTGAPEGAVGS